MNIQGYRGARGVGVRRHRLAVPSVGCVNHTLESAAQQDSSVSILTHQGGCGMLRADVEQYRELMAGTLANPNVAVGVIVGLGCESNQSAAVLDRAIELGANASALVLQSLGGVDGTATAIAQRLESADENSLRVRVGLAEIRVAVVVNHDAGEPGSQHAEELAAALGALGLSVFGPVRTRTIVSPAAAGQNVPEIWEAHPERIVREVEGLSGAAASGAVIAVAIARQATPLGSPVMPVIRVATDPAWVHTSDFTWADDGPGVPEALLQLIEATANGRLTLGERFGLRDFAPTRVAPTM